MASGLSAMAADSSTVIVDVGQLDRDFTRADIEFQQVDHSGPSFEARVFLNNPEATADTPLVPEEGYAGAFHIFGHGGCFGEVGHCDVPSRRPFDPRPEHPLSPARKVLICTDALRKVIEDTQEVAVTVGAVVTSVTEKTEDTNFLEFGGIRVLTYT